MLDYFDGANELLEEFMRFMLETRISIRDTKLQIKALTEKYDLTKSEFALMHFLSLKPNILVKELANLVELSSSTVVIRLNVLEEKNIIERKRSKDDRRKVSISLTKKGINIIKQLTSDPFKPFMEKLTSLDPKDRDDLLRILKKLNQDNQQLIPDVFPFTKTMMKEFLGF